MSNETTLVTCDQETAKKELMRWCSAWFRDMDLDKVYSEVEDEEYNSTVKSFVKAIIQDIQKGLLVVAEDPENIADVVICHNLRKPLNKDGSLKFLRYHALTLGDLRKSDDFAPGQNFAKSQALIAGMAKINQGLLSNMHAMDCVTAMRVTAIFFS